MRLKIILFGFLLTLAAALWFGLAHRAPVDFSADIKPILNKKCMACHGGVRRMGGFSLLTRAEALAPTEAGRPAIVPGDPDVSELVRRITCPDLEQRMPYREEPLSGAEIELFRRWIAEGAVWGEHWAYRPVERPALPGDPTAWSFFGKKNDDSAPWGANEIDAFVLQKLRTEGLEPSPEADRQTLLRRSALDLTGLPPDEKIASQFLNDSTPGAYNRLIDSLLAAPTFGERWASVWLDLARYADTKGYESDTRRNIWRYRDWLIRAFDSDMPYDQFLTEQLAGDLLPEPNFLNLKSENQLLFASSFHRNTLTNDEGGTENEEFRTAAVLDRVNTTWEAVLGTTFACVQCHSHPYDPFFHEEYYQFAAFFNQNRDEDTYDDHPVLRIFSKKDSLDVLKLKRWLTENTQPAEQKRVAALVEQWQPVWYGLECDSMHNADLLSSWYLGLSNRGSARLPKVRLDGMTQLVARFWVMAPGGRVTIRVGQADGPLLLSIAPGPKKDAWQVEAFDFQAFSGTQDLYFFYENKNLASQPDEFGVQFDWFAFTQKFPGEGKTGYAEAKNLFWKTLRADCETTPVMYENPEGYRRKTQVFERGNWLVPGAEVQPGTPRNLHPFPADAPRDRLGLARWLCDSRNPLTARVMVNRLWEQLFGIGLVETVEDFGSQGTEPSHPALLDWLAWRLMHEHNWSLKKTLRDIVLSATYRQRSEAAPALLARDPANRLLARGPRVRLGAEQIRDQSLALSGLLSLKKYGPPVMPWQPDGIWKSPWNGEKWEISAGENRYRRAVYTFWKRTSPYPSFMTFDAAGRQVCSARRVRTNTPLQALVTLNDPVFVECARFFALKIEKSASGSDAARQISQGYRLATGCEIGAEKLTVLKKLYDETLAKYRAEPSRTKTFLKDLPAEKQTPEMAALAATANALLNLDEVLTKF